MRKFLLPAIIVVGLIFGAKFFLFRGGPPGGMPGEMPPPVIETGIVIEREITDKIQATGRVEAVDEVNIIPRIDGFLKYVYFKEGSYVKKGDLLFLIEPDKYQIATQQTKAAIIETKAALNEAEKMLTRMTELVEKDYASKAQFDEALAARDRAKALLDVKQANYDQAKLNLSYTKIYAPMSGKIGKLQIDEGNYITPASGPLAKIVKLSPIYVNYKLSSEDYLALSTKTGSVEIELPDKSTYPEKGKIVFFDNEINATTGTIEARAEFQNTDHVLLPGQFANVVMNIGEPQKAILVAQEAVLVNPQGKYLYTFQEDSTVKIRPIVTDKQHEGFWVVKQGLKAGEKVVVQGTQKLRPDIKVMDRSQMQVKKDAK